MIDASCTLPIRRRLCTGQYTTSPTVWYMLAVPPLLLLLGMLWTGGRERRQAGGGWHLSAAQVAEQARAIQNVMLPEAVVLQIAVEPEEGTNRDGSWRGLWRSNVHVSQGLLFAAVWEDATGVLVQFSRTSVSPSPPRGWDSALKSEAAAEQAAKNWVSKLYSTKAEDWHPSETKKLGTAYWRTSFVGPEGRLLVELEAATGKPTYLAFRSIRSTQIR